MMIAFIEDNKADFDAFSRFLRGHDVKHFTMLEEYVSSNDNFDLIVSDLSLPISDTNEVLDALKDKNPIILTGLAKEIFDELRIKLNRAGFKHVLSKDDGPQQFGRYVRENFG